MKTQTVLRFLFLLIWVVPLAGCTSSQPILIGVSVELTGRRSELGVAARDGAILAIETINSAGGVNGRQLKLLIRDDQGSLDGARQVDAQLVKDGVVAVIGHLTSEQTEAVFDQMNQAGVVLISPTSSSTLFSHQADYFFRSMQANDFMARSMAYYIYNSGVSQVLGIYDMGNQAFSETYWDAFKRQFISLGGDASHKLTFTSGNIDLKAVAEAVASGMQPQAILFIASAIDTAVLMQYLGQLGVNSRFFSSTWAQTDQLLEKGGAAVDGMIMAGVYDPNDSRPAYTAFVRRFQDRFQRLPSLGAGHSYEAVLMLAHALGETGGSAQGLPEALVKIKNLPGVHGIISVDQYGDVLRDVYILQVKDRRFVTIDTIPPEE